MELVLFVFVYSFQELGFFECLGPLFPTFYFIPVTYLSVGGGILVSHPVLTNRALRLNSHLWCVTYLSLETLPTIMWLRPSSRFPSNRLIWDHRRPYRNLFEPGTERTSSSEVGVPIPPKPSLMVCSSFFSVKILVFWQTTGSFPPSVSLFWPPPGPSHSRGCRQEDLRSGRHLTLSTYPSLFLKF